MTTRFTWLLITSLLTLGAACGDGAHRGPTLPVAAQDPVTAHAEQVLAARRAVALDRLHAYGEAAVYPVDEQGLPTGVFRDARGVRCPMSELIFLSGRGDLVDAVVSTNNRLKLADVHDGPLLAWMLESGLTQEEIIEVQGLMDISELPINLELGKSDLQIAAANAVTRKLTTLETKLRKNAIASVRTAAARLPARTRRAIAPPVVAELK